jgi:Uma2 family endonuclease
MAVSVSRPRKTIEDYLALADDVRAELIHGDLYVTSAPTPRHQAVVDAVHSALKAYVKESARGVVYFAPLDVVLPSGDVVQPDVIWVSTQGRDIVRDRIEGVPSLVVEVVSPTHPERDRIVKKALYAGNGVPEYWIVDLESKSVEVFRLDGSEYRPAGYFTAGTHVASPSLPGFRAAVDDLFRDPWATS